MNKVLIVDDDVKVRTVFSATVKKHGFGPVLAATGNEALELCRRERPHAVLLDLRMPGMDGMETLLEIRKIDADLPVIIVTAHGDIPQAVEATKQGAYDFISKPPDFNKLMLTVARAVEHYALKQKVKTLHDEVGSALVFLLGKGETVRQMIEQIPPIARSDFSLILQGETGTGKTFLARMIHSISKRATGPFVSVDIGAIPDTLLESELFGHEKGAFTGADRRKTGYFEAANNGTLFLDELQNASSYVQSKFLAALEERRIHPLGADTPVEIDVRVIAATSHDARKSVHQHQLREDLFYRLGEFMISLLPLRERTDDITYLAEKFLYEAADDMNKPLAGFSPDAMTILRTWLWPGNIRELKNVVRRAVLVTDDPVIQPRHIHFLTAEQAEQDKQQPVPSSAGLPSLNLPELEKIAIREALDKAGGNRTLAASHLGIDYRTLLRKLKTSH